MLSAALIPERAEILVDATEASREPRRARESIAHELGHWVLHRGPDRTLCRDAVIDPVAVVTLEENASPEPWRNRVGRTGPAIEWEANVFGGAMLLPPWLVQEAWERNPDLEALADEFEVSLPAMQTRSHIKSTKPPTAPGSATTGSSTPPERATPPSRLSAGRR